MRRARLSAAGVVLCAVVWAAVHPVDVVAADPWLKLKTSNFELYTTAGERRGRDTILHFERVRSFFLEAGNLKSNSEVPTRIIAFRSRGEYRPYQPGEFTAAYYQPGNSGQDYIVMGTLGAEAQPIAVHEYVHLLVRHSGAKLPPWMNEGMAELFSTLRPIGKRVEVGGIIPGRMHSLQTTKWLDLETLTGMGEDYAHGTNREQTEMLYAQGWALTHMLWLSDGYRMKLSEFLNAINSEKSSAEAFQSVYGKSVEDVEKDLQRYFRGNRVNVGNYDIRLEKSAEEVTTEPVKPFESGMMLAELLVHGDKVEEGRKAYEHLAAESAQDDPESAELLGYFAWRSLDDPGEGKRHFARAVEQGSQHGRLYFDYAMLLGPDDPMVLELLQKAVELEPDLTDAQYQLGALFYQQKMYARAVVQFNQVRQISRERAVPMFRAMAHAYYELGNGEEAHKAAEQARQYSRSPAEIAESEQLLDYLSYRPPTPTEAAENTTDRRGSPQEARQPGGYSEVADEEEAAETPVLRRRGQAAANEPEPAEPRAPAGPLPQRMPLETAAGTLRQFECLDNAARVVIDASGQERKFVIRDPSNVVIRGTDSYTVDFTCGEQKPREVVILYEPAAQEDVGAAGVVRVIEFK